MVVPISAAARMTEVPSGTATSWPSMVSDTIVRAAAGAGLVPRSISPIQAISHSAASAGAGMPKSSGKKSSALSTG